jgi:cation transport regulator ChaB
MEISYTLDADAVIEALLGFDSSVSWSAVEEIDNSLVIVSHGLDRDIDCSGYFTEDELRQSVESVISKNLQVKYTYLRKAAYDKLNQFEMQFDDAANGTTTWVDAVNKIKSDYPKGVIDNGF